ncbi:putative mannose-p-dolichol utilization defect 1 protein [Phaeoacremonium minimum UCRPA7]|uniref:Mannose-P-dolichol utilization defect 1 protein homolog n=1 Tax=Phaeoacremonium minimum (strain UCR-PA7) TaxID=1286976 RepID=R8BME0_PHAM7|nr:putative mannose-p-dolichol utilization defect 1 protein [Phaeoacremonium minimum UCRPA7]EOO00492.1 putative mannose-p-dolichol utilization defect 1 protein [Phaeoacremonium minimum UCRPA7]
MDQALLQLRSTLQPVLQPVTRSLPPPVRDFGISLLGHRCYQHLVVDVDVTDTKCLQLAISKALGIGIVAASSIVKVPQIINLVNSKSAAGISFLSYLLETSSYLISLAYNVRNGFPFSTYGETALILGQNVIITVLVLRYSGKTSMAALFVAALAASVATLFTETVVDMGTLGYLQAGAGTLGVASKLPQIIAIWQEGSTGQLSAFAVFNYLIGSLVRIFTTFQEVDDKLILYSFIAGFALNLVLAAQMVYYWNTPSKKALGKQKEKASIEAAPSASTTATTPKSKTPTTRRRG